MPVLAAVLLAFALRLLRLPQLGDLEFDEIVSVRYAALPADALLGQLAGAIFEHPPAFYLALGWWRQVAGQPEVLARFFSVIPGTLTVPLTYAVARRLWSERVGQLAALLVAIAPLPVFYSREVRMYALVSCLALASFWLLLRAATGNGSRRQWVAYATLGALAAYVHYLGAALLVGQVVAAMALRRRLPHLTRPVLLCFAAIAALGLPWLISAQGMRASLPALSRENAVTILPGLWQTWQELAAGPESTGALAVIAGIVLLAIALAGRPQSPTASAMLAGVLLAGAAGVVFALALGKPAQPRYILPLAPLVYAGVAAGLSRAAVVARPLGVLAGAGLLVGFVPFWSSYYVNYARADYSDITRQITRLEQPGDVVLLTGPWQAWYFDYYYSGTLSHRVLPENAPPALDPAVAATQLAALQAQRRRIWFVQAGLAQADPTNYVERWLQRNSWPALREAHRNAVLQLYALSAPEHSRPLQPVAFGGAISLSGGTVDADDIRSGDVARLTLDFVRTGDVPGPLKASIRLLGADGQRTAIDLDLVQATEERERAVSQWPLGQTVQIKRGLWIPPAMGPQPYEIRLVVYDPATLAPLAPEAGAGLGGSAGAGARGGAGADSGARGGVGAAPANTSSFGLSPGPSAGLERYVGPGGEASVGELFVTQSLATLEPAAGASTVPLSQVFGGGDFDTISLRALSWQQANPSTGPLVFDVRWRLEGLTGTEHISTLSVVDQGGRVWTQAAQPLFAGTFPMETWREGEALDERRALDLSQLPDGRYRILLSLADSRGRILPVHRFGPHGGTSALGEPGGAVEVASVALPYRRPLGERVWGMWQRAQRWARLVPGQ